MNKIPEKWYVLYSNKGEFDIINKHFNKGWTYFGSYKKLICKENGYTNIDTNNNWVGTNGGGINIEELKELNATEISFSDFKKYILKKNPIKVKKERLIYLVKLFKQLNIK